MGFLGAETASVDIYYVVLWKARGGSLAGAGIPAATPQVHLCQFAHPFLVLLLIIQISAGMTISYMLSDYMVDDTADPVARFAVFRYYGTFTKTLLTMFLVFKCR